MYIPRHFEVTDNEKIFAFIESNAFGQLISFSQGGLFSTHIPFLVSEDRTKLLGHLAKQNPQHLDIENQEVMVTLAGPHDYISPAWYASPGVPTWNYQAIHVYGFCKVLNEVQQIKKIVDSLTNKYESAFQEPWQPDYKASMLGAIIGVEITITKIQCKYKLSQNRSTRDQKQVVKQLEKLGSDKLAVAMQQHDL